MVAHNLADVDHPGIARPADDSLPRPKQDPGRSEANPAHHPVPLRTNQVPDLPTRRPASALRMMRLHHRLPAAALLRCRNQGQRKRTEIPKRTAGRTVTEIRRRAGVRGRLHRLRLRKTRAPLLRHAQQNPARRHNPPRPTNRFSLTQSTWASGVRDRSLPLRAPRNHPAVPPISDECQSACPGESHEISRELAG